MKIKLTHTHTEEVIATYHYDENTTFVKKKQRSPKSKNVCQICHDSKIKVDVEVNECNFDETGHLNSIQCEQCHKSVCTSCFKKNVEPILCTTSRCDCKHNSISFGTGLMHICPFCRLKTNLSPYALSILVYETQKRFNDKFDDGKAFSFWTDFFG